MHATMRLCSILCLATLAVSAPLAVEEKWQQWKQQHGKIYPNEVEESMRRAVWFRTYHYIHEHNTAGSHSYQLGVNRFADTVSDGSTYFQWSIAYLNYRLLCGNNYC